MMTVLTALFFAFAFGFSLFVITTMVRGNLARIEQLLDEYQGKPRFGAVSIVRLASPPVVMAEKSRRASGVPALAGRSRPAMPGQRSFSPALSRNAVRAAA
ncbi:MAG: hypothetical protein R3E02_03645 [Blastomonas sp.]